MNLSCSYTGVGSLPFRKPQEAVSYVFDHYAIPFLPQLPKRSFQEQMLYQFMEDFPGLTQNGNHFFVDIDTFFARDDGGGFSFSFLSTLDLFLQKSKKVPVVKVQMTSPFTIASHLLCSDKKLLLDHPKMYEYLLSYMEEKAFDFLDKFQEQQLFVFFDEPTLTPFQGEEIFSMLRRLIQKLKTPFRLFGIHSCNNWSPSLFAQAFESDFQVINFDIQRGLDEILEDKEAMFRFLKRGWIMWGVVDPSTFDRGMPPDHFFIDSLKNKGLKEDEVTTILRRSLFSPACGTAGFTIEQEKKCLAVLKEIAEYSKRGVKDEN